MNRLKSKYAAVLALLAVAASTALAWTVTTTQPMGAYDKFSWLVYVTDPELVGLQDAEVIVEFESWNGSSWDAVGTSECTTGVSGLGFGDFYVQATGIEGGENDFFRIKIASVVKSGWHVEQMATPIPSEWSTLWTWLSDNGSGGTPAGKNYSKTMPSVQMGYGD